MIKCCMSLDAQALIAEETEDEEELGDHHHEAGAEAGSSPDDITAKRRQAVLERLEGQENPLAASFKASIVYTSTPHHQCPVVTCPIS